VGRLGNATPNASGAKDQGIDSVLTRTAKRLSLLAAAYVLLAVYFAYLWVRALLQGKRGRVLVGREGMQITDWRGRSREVAWSQVQRASLIDCAGFRKPPRLILKLAGGTVRFSLWLVAPNLLLKEIVRRADLREAPRNWYRQSYIRTGTAD